MKYEMMKINKSQYNLLEREREQRAWKDNYRLANLDWNTQKFCLLFISDRDSDCNIEINE